MKKLYSLFIMLALALACPAVAAASAITVIVDNPQAVQLGTYEYDASNNRVFVPIEGGTQESNVVEFDSYISLYVLSNDNYAIKSVKKDDVEQMYSTPQLEYSIYSYTDGEIFFVETQSLDEILTASFTVNVDDPSKVALRTGGSLGKDIKLTEASTVIKFDPVNGNNIQLAHSDYNLSLYSVKLNNVEQTAQYGRYSIDVANGDVIDIVANIPDKDITVKVDVPEGCEGVFKSLQKKNGYAYEDLEGDFLAGATVKAGTPLQLNLDGDNFNITGLYNNRPL